jgi:hypothetical protein
MKRASMFLYEVIGGTKKERALIEEAVIFAKQYLIPQIRNLEVEIKLMKNMEVDADVVGDEREFFMRIRKGQSHEDLLTAVFHEMVHVKQYIRNEFPVFEVGCDVDYLDRPWEKEAYDLQELMLDTYNLT